MRREAALVDRPAPSMERDRLLHRQGESQCTALLEAAELQRRRQGGVGRGGMVLVRGAGEVGGMGARHGRVGWVPSELLNANGDALMLVHNLVISWTRLVHVQCCRDSWVAARW